MANINDFKTELRDLLDRYNASIKFTCNDSSDTYGLTGDSIIVKIGDKEILRTHSWSLDSRDLK